MNCPCLLSDKMYCVIHSSGTMMSLHWIKPLSDGLQYSVFVWSFSVHFAPSAAQCQLSQSERDFLHFRLVRKCTEKWGDSFEWVSYEAITHIINDISFSMLFLIKMEHVRALGTLTGLNDPGQLHFWPSPCSGLIYLSHISLVFGLLSLPELILGVLGFSSAGPGHAPPIPDLRTSLITTNYFYGDLASVELGCHRRSALLLALR